MMYFSVFFNLVQSNILTLLALSMITFPQKLIKVYVVLFLLFFFETWIIDVNQLNDLYYGFAYFFSIVFYAKCITKISYREYIIPALLMLSLVTFVYVLPTCFENNLNALVYSIENGFILVIVKHVLKVILLFVTLQIGYSLARVFTNELKYFHIFLLVLVFSQMLLICLKESLQVATIQRYYSLLGILLLLIVDMLLGFYFIVFKSITP